MFLSMVQRVPCAICFILFVLNIFPLPQVHSGELTFSWLEWLDPDWVDVFPKLNMGPHSSHVRKYQRVKAPLNHHGTVKYMESLFQAFLTTRNSIYLDPRGDPADRAEGGVLWINSPSKVRIGGLFHLPINGVYWGYNPLILTIC